MGIHPSGGQAQCRSVEANLHAATLDPLERGMQIDGALEHDRPIEIADDDVWDLVPGT